MPRDTRGMRSNRRERELLGIGGGTSRSDPVYPPTGKRVRVGDSGRDSIHVDDAVRPSLSTMYTRRSGGRPMITPVNTHDLPGGGYHDDELGPLVRARHREYPEHTIYEHRLNGRPMITPVITHNLPDDHYRPDELRASRAEHTQYPTPNDYTVRTIHSADVRTHGCRCAHGCRWDPVTGQAEFFCRCGNRDCDPADYAGEWEDDRPLFMRDDLKTKGLFGGNPYKC
jgi:hypothetical protein